MITYVMDYYGCEQSRVEIRCLHHQLRDRLACFKFSIIISTFLTAVMKIRNAVCGNGHNLLIVKYSVLHYHALTHYL